MRNDKLERFVEINRLIKELEEEKKSLQYDLLLELGDDPVYSEEGNKITKSKRTQVVLAPDIDVQQVKAEFPFCVKEEVDLDQLKATPDAHKFLTTKVSEFVLVGKAPKKE